MAWIYLPGKGGTAHFLSQRCTDSVYSSFLGILEGWVWSKPELGKGRDKYALTIWYLNSKKKNI